MQMNFTVQRKTMKEANRTMYDRTERSVQERNGYTNVNVREWVNLNDNEIVVVANTKGWPTIQGICDDHNDDQHPHD
jgi:hypothetical protein